MTGASLLLHAAVPASEGRAGVGRALGARFVRTGSVAAVVGPFRRESPTRVALRHARVVAGALAGCSSVVPFRAGIELPSEQDVRDLLAENELDLRGRLHALAGYVEMGLKLRVPAPSGLDPARLDLALDPVRALAGPTHRQERRRPLADGFVLEACYLVLRERVEPYWAAVAALRAGTGLPVLGTGPWAPYSFADLSLRPASRTQSPEPILDRRPS